MLESIFGFFAVGMIGFWLLVLIASIIFITGAESDNYVLSAIVTILLGIAYWKPLMAVGLSWQVIAVCVSAYVIFGIGWSAWRWWKYVHQTVERVKKSGRSYMERDGVLTDEDKERIKLAVNVSDNKGRIIGWMAYWPWSAFWNVTGDFFTMVYDSMKSAYQRIADKALEKLGIS